MLTFFILFSSLITCTRSISMDVGAGVSQCIFFDVASLNQKQDIYGSFQVASGGKANATFRTPPPKHPPWICQLTPFLCSFVLLFLCRTFSLFVLFRCRHHHQITISTPKPNRFSGHRFSDHISNWQSGLHSRT